MGINWFNRVRLDTSKRRGIGDIKRKLSRKYYVRYHGSIVRDILLASLDLDLDSRDLEDRFAQQRRRGSSSRVTCGWRLASSCYCLGSFNQLAIRV